MGWPKYVSGTFDSVLAASKLKVLSRERLVKTQADLNESPFLDSVCLG